VDLVLFDAPPEVAVFRASKPFLIVAERVVLDFIFRKTAGLSTAIVEWYLEFASDDPNAAATRWFREVAEEDVGAGVTHMPPVVRDFSGIPTGTTARSCHLVRSHRFCRVQVQLAFASPDLLQRLTITTPFGIVAQAPVLGT
jgi:hypothetical protein